jgi:hypothetical protein
LALADTDKAFDNFLAECLAAPSLCTLANVTAPGATIESLKLAIGEALQDLYESQRTIPVGIGAITFQSGLVPVALYEHIKRSIFMALYTPTKFGVIDSTLRLLLERNLTAFEAAPAAPADSSTPAVTPYNEGFASFWALHARTLCFEHQA